MRLSQYEIINKSIIVLGICGLLLACEQNRELVPLDSFSSSTAVSYKVDVNFCTPPAETQKLKVKTVIILDHSGSNGENYRMDPSGSGAPALPLEVDPIYATDPLGLTRYGTPDTPGTLLNYLSTLPANDPANPDFYFSVVNFANGAQTFPTNQTFTSNIEGFYNQTKFSKTPMRAEPARPTQAEPA